MSTKYVLGTNAARKLRTMFGGSAGNSSSERSLSNITDEVKHPHLYEVRWAQSVNDGDGAWIIYIPLSSNGSAYFDYEELEGIVGDLDEGWWWTPAGAGYPAGWWIIGHFDTGRAEYNADITLTFVVEDPDSEDQPESEPYWLLGFNRAEDPPTGMKNVEFHIATVSRSTTTGETKVEQISNSPIYYTTGNGSGEIEDNGCFAIDSISFSGSIRVNFKNCYLQIGGKMYEAQSCAQFSSSTWTGGIICLKMSASGSIESATLTSYPSIAELQTNQEDLNYYIHPLYEINYSGKVLCDFRNIPLAAMGEF